MSDEDEQIFCFLCNKVEDNPKRVLECIQCCKSAHLTCLKISGNGVQKAKKKNYYCSSTCAEIYSRNTNKSTGFDELVGEIRTLAAVIRDVKEDTAKTNYALAQTQNQMKAIVKTTQKIEHSQEFLAREFEVMKGELKHFNEELERMRASHNDIRKDVDHTQDRQQYLEQKVDRMELELDKMQRLSLSRNAVILGVPYMENEDVKNLVSMIGAAVKLVFQEGDVTTVRRLRAKSGMSVASPIIVTFRAPEVKEALFDCKRTHGTLLASSISDIFNTSTNRITIRDEMTSYGKELLERVKQFQAELEIKYVWYGRNGKVLLRRQDGAKVEEICNLEQLYALAKSRKRGLDTSSMSTQSQSSPVQEPGPKRQNRA